MFTASFPLLTAGAKVLRLPAASTVVAWRYSVCSHILLAPGQVIKGFIVMAATGDNYSPRRNSRTAVCFDLSAVQPLTSLCFSCRGPYVQGRREHLDVWRWAKRTVTACTLCSSFVLGTKHHLDSWVRGKVQHHRRSNFCALLLKSELVKRF